VQVCSAPRCANPPLNGYLCRRCAKTLMRDLAALPWLLRDLKVTISKQDRISEPSGRSGGESPLPMRIDPIEARRDLHATLAAWAQHIAGKLTGLPPGIVWTEIRLAAFLIGHMRIILTDFAAGQLADEIGNAVMRIQRAIDQPPEMIYAGPCDDCEWDLYAHPSRGEVECHNPDCGAVYDIAARRDWLLDKVEYQLATATELSKALAGLLQRDLTASMIRNYASRGRLTQHPPHPSKPREPLYRVGDVRRLIAEVAHEEIRGRPAC